MRFWLIGLAAMFLLGGCVIIDADNASIKATYSGDHTAAEEDILALLQAQNEAWNRGDIETFMLGYWKSDQLRFGSGGKITLGWQATLDNYKTRYHDEAAMGTLAFTDLDVQVVGPNAAIVHGRWALTRAQDKPSGLFTLVFREFGEGWVIVSDTTTSAG